MAYSVYTVAAAEFMTAFYERLFAGDRVADAVTAGRAQLALNDRRPSMKGPLPLHDWMVPVLYARSDVRFPGLRTVRAPEVAVSAALARLREGADDGDHELAPEGEFVGRDAAFYTLEVAARLRRVVVVHGSGGTGKSELAKAFGRWWRDTGGVDRPAWSIWHSFEPGVASFGLDGVVNSVGRRLFAGQEEEFARLDPAARQAAVEKVLANQRVLLLWDNFESVREMPDPGRATPPLSPAEQDRIRAFLDRIARGGRSAVIITSRTPESWLGPVPQRVELGGLDDEEAARYADHLLAGVPNADARRADRNFADLMRWLDGHPLSMRLTLPHLESVGARQLLDGLAGLTALPGEEEADTGDRRGSLNACVAYSFAHLDAKDQRALTVLSLVQGVASVATLEVFSGLAETPGRFRGLSDDDWFGLFGRAADLGLLTPLGADMFGLHPALPAHLAARWRAQAPATHGRERAAALETLAFAYGAFGHWLLGEIIGGNAQLAFTLVRTQQRMFGAVLGHALDREEWGIALDLLLPLDAYGQAQGLAQELLAWTDRVRLAVEAPDGTPPAPDSPAGALWVYVVNAQAGRDVLAGRPDQAEAECRAVLHAFGWKPGAKNHPDLVLTFHLLGVVAQLRGHLDDAETWLRKALTIRKGLEHQPDIANSYHQLGIVAQLRGDLKDSETWHRKALTVRTRLGNRPDLATTFHQLGVVAYLRGDLDDAETWYGRALALKEELGDLAGLANTCHQLGALAQERGHLDNAEGWHHRALVLREDLGDHPGLAATYHQLGLLAEMRQDPAQALAWLVSCVSLFDEFPSPFTDPAPRNLRRLTARLGLPALERAWLDATGDQLPPAVRAYVLADAPDAEPGDPGGPEPEPGAAPGGRSRGRRPLTSFLRRALRHDPDRR
jgi:tetratricopeptide (TPR) repeat protein